jgi:hypothetical protein
MKNLALVLFALGVTACGGALKNTNLSGADSASQIKEEADLKSQDFEASAAPQLEAELGLTKKGGSHDCTCTIKNVRYSLGSCSKKLPLSCSNSLGRDKIIASQFTGGSTRFWFAK